MLSVFPDQVLCWLLVYHIIFFMFKYVPSICFFGAFIIKCWTLPKAFSHLLVWPCDVCICSVWAHLRVLDRSCVWWSEADVRYRLLTSFHCISEGHSQLHHLSLNLDFTFSITVADQGATGLSYFPPFPSQPLALRCMPFIWEWESQLRSSCLSSKDPTHRAIYLPSLVSVFKHMYCYIICIDLNHS